MKGLPEGLKTLDVFLNYACQAKCPFCYNPPLNDALNRWRLPLEALAGRLLDGAKAGYHGVTFSGGEVTLLADLPKILRLARKAGYEAIGVISNGLRLADAAYAEELVDSGLTFCCLSLHAPEAALHDRLVAVPGAYDKLLRALDHLRARSIPVVLNYVLVRENLDRVAAFAERFAAEPGVVELQLYFPHYEGLMAVHADALRVRMSEAAPHLERALAAARRAGAGDRVRLYNMPPCAAVAAAGPESLRNWEREEDSLLVDPKGSADGAFLPERRDRVKRDPCARCSLDSRCLGFERGYVERYGDAELRPL